MSKHTGAELVVRALEDEAIPFAFGIPGAQNLELYDVLDRSSSVQPVLVTDEQSASFMADGVSRSSCQLGCVNLVPGAGLTHALSGIAEAFMDGVPLLVLVSGVRSDTGKSFQLHDIPQLDVVLPVTKARYRTGDGGAIYNVVRKACHIARQPPQGPVVVEIPAEMFVFRYEQEPVEAAAEGPGPRQPSSELVAALSDSLRGCRRPLLYVGQGALGASAQIVALAENLQSPVATTIQGKGVFPETHPLWLWCGFGKSAPKSVQAIVRECDATLAIGCRFAEVGTGSYGIEPPRPLIHVDIDPTVFNKNFQADDAIESDALEFVDMLLAQLLPRERDEQLVQSIRNAHEAVRDEWASWRGQTGVLGPSLFNAVQTTFGPDTVYVTDSGNGLFVAVECLRLTAPRSFLAPVDFSCMGYALPAAIGARLASPDRAVVAFMGDGAFLMTGLELMTAAQLRVPIALFILRDRELSQIAQFQDTAFARRSASDLPDFDLGDLCRGLRVAHLRIDDETELFDRVVESSQAVQSGPVVIEVLFDNTHRTFFTKGVVQTNFGRLPWLDRARFVARALGRRLT